MAMSLVRFAHFLHSDYIGHLKEIFNSANSESEEQQKFYVTKSQYQKAADEFSKFLQEKVLKNSNDTVKMPENLFEAWAGSNTAQILDYRFLLTGMILLCQLPAEKKLDYIFDLFAKSGHIDKDSVGHIIKLLYSQSLNDDQFQERSTDLLDAIDFHMNLLLPFDNFFPSIFVKTTIRILLRLTKDTLSKENFIDQLKSEIPDSSKFLHEISEAHVALFSPKESPGLKRNTTVAVVQFFHPEFSVGRLEDFFTLFEKMDVLDGVVSKYQFRKFFEARGLKNGSAIEHLFLVLNSSHNTDFLDAETWLTNMALLHKAPASVEKQQLVFDFLDVLWSGRITLVSCQTLFQLLLFQKTPTDISNAAEQFFESCIRLVEQQSNSKDKEGETHSSEEGGLNNSKGSESGNQNITPDVPQHRGRDLANSTAEPESSITLDQWKQMCAKHPDLVEQVPNIYNFFVTAVNKDPAIFYGSGLRASAMVTRNHSSNEKNVNLKNF